MSNRAGLKEILDNLNGKILAVDFTATWCGPCQKIGPKFEAMCAEMHDRVVGVKVDTDEAEPELLEHFNIKAMPTFVFMRGGSSPEVVFHMAGANEPVLRQSLMIYSSAAAQCQQCKRTVRNPHHPRKGKCDGPPCERCMWISSSNTLVCGCGGPGTLPPPEADP